MKNTFTKLAALLSGKKTYLATLVFAVFNILIQYNVITVPPKTVDVVNVLLAALGLSFIRLGVAKSAK